MSELAVILLISVVAKNIVNVIKMFTITAQKMGAVFLLLSGVFGGVIIWVLGLEINVFGFMGVETTTRVSIFNGVLIGLMGQDFYKILKLIQQKTPPKIP